MEAVGEIGGELFASKEETIPRTGAAAIRCFARRLGMGLSSSSSMGDFRRSWRDRMRSFRDNVFVDLSR